jgi:NDP-sugar pyrophosphorylase family protein
VVMNDGKWFNIGSRTEYLGVHRTILEERWTPYYIQGREWPARAAKSAVIDPSAQLHGCSVVGERCRIGGEALLEDTILWPDAQIASKSQLHGCIVRSRKKVSGVHCNVDI